VAQLVREAVQSRGLSLREIGRRMGQAGFNPLYRAMHGVVTLRTVILIADTLDYDVVIHFRDRRSVSFLQGGETCHS
jgi:hypothetical protein